MLKLKYFCKNTSETKRPTYPVGVNVLVIRDNKLLLGKRKKAYGAGTWGLPGGHLEIGEAMEEAAARELMEETGLEAKSYEFSNLINDRSGVTHYLQIGFIANNINGEPILNEPDFCEEWRWFDLDNLPQELFIGHIEQINAYLHKSNFIDS